ncbi:MAG TPA: tyrosine-type recombinase/integrase, partial [Solirubrobacteraceae bacterium]|nr:tyrosine-type recombinase/integrase [Solirubrobacteraceae bacterium]
LVTSSRIPSLFDPPQARRLLDAAGALPDNPRAPKRGATYRTLFALCYGLGLRAGEACGLRIGDVDTARDLLVVRGGKFGICRFRHMPKYVASRTMLRWLAGPTFVNQTCPRSGL